jgi:hypothetical protein
MADAQEPDPSRRRLLVVGGTALAVAACVGGYFLLRTPPDATQLRGLGAYTFSNTEQIYLGNHRLARKPAVVDSSRVYAAIAEYQQIQREGLKPDGPKYHILMVKASERFNPAVKAAAAQGGHDVVAEAGTVKPVNPANAPPPDITQATLAALR